MAFILYLYLLILTLICLVGLLTDNDKNSFAEGKYMQTNSIKMQHALHSCFHSARCKPTTLERWNRVKQINNTNHAYHTVAVYKDQMRSIRQASNSRRNICTVPVRDSVKKISILKARHQKCWFLYPLQAESTSPHVKST